MKKLIVSMVATASIALVAKADVLNGTSFENYQGENGFQVGLDDSGLPNGNGELYWSGGDDAQFEFIEVAAGDKTVRPKYWDGKADAQALAIDTDVALARHVANKDAGPQAIGNGLYFDSMVQFTATTDAPQVEANTSDKLVVWLKEIEGTEGQLSTYKLCVTAGVWDSLGHITVTEFENTNQEIAVSPDEWYRLSISVSADEDGYPLFEVRVNGKLFAAGDVNKFMSLAYEAEDAKTITSVSFQGKGAIDDLVWTTEDPFVAPTAAVALSFKYADGLVENDNVSWYYNDEDLTPENGAASLDFAIGSKVVFTCETPVGYIVKGFTKVTEDEDVITWTSSEYTVVAEGLNLSFEITKDIAPVEPVAQIGDKTYDTLGAAIAAAVTDDTITLLDNIATDAAFVIEKTIAINLNGKNVQTTENDKSGDGVFWVKKGGVLTIGGNGTVNGVGGNRWNIAVFADGGTVIINGGTYTNVGAQGPDMTHFDLIYAKNGGRVEINGGTFICATPKWTLNSHDSLTGTFEVKGGMFKGYDPSNMETENGLTSWCPAGYEAKLNGDYYEVAKKTTEALKPGASTTVTATTEAEALAKVELSVTVPEGVDATKYTGYFTLKATDNGDGTWAVAAVLKDEVKPVIEATTDDKGVVTPAISFGANGEVTINISNELPGLFYGVKYATTVGGVETAEAIPGLTVTPKAGNTAGFFRVVVDFKEIPAADAE